jgi:hypothetical protein
MIFTDAPDTQTTTSWQGTYQNIRKALIKLFYPGQ